MLNSPVSHQDIVQIALFALVSDLWHSQDGGDVTVLVFLDLSMAFNVTESINHYSPALTVGIKEICSPCFVTSSRSF